MTLTENLVENIKDIFSIESNKISLGLLYDIHTLNPYGKTILSKVGIELYEPVSGLNAEKQLNLALTFKEKCQRGECDKYSFIFWALMVLTVDATDKERHLVQIYGFSKFLEINNEEMKNIMHLTRLVYRNKG